MAGAVERRRIVTWLAMLLAVPMLAACESRGMFGQRGSESGDDDQDSDGGMGGGTGGGTSGGGGGY